MPGARAQTNESLTRVIAPRTGTETGTETGTGTKAPRHQGTRDQGTGTTEKVCERFGRDSIILAIRRCFTAAVSAIHALPSVHGPSPAPAGTGIVGHAAGHPAPVRPASPCGCPIRCRHIPGGRRPPTPARRGDPRQPAVGRRHAEQPAPPWAARPPTGCFRAPSATGQAAPRWNGPLSGWRYCPPARQTGC